MRVTLDLTEDELNLLEAAVLDFCDEGPRAAHGGWRSGRMQQLTEKFTEALLDARAPEVRPQDTGFVPTPYGASREYVVPRPVGAVEVQSHAPRCPTCNGLLDVSEVGCACPHCDCEYA